MSVAETARREWQLLLQAAMLGTDRHLLAPAGDGWDAWARDSDPAVQLLNRAAAVSAARRAGAQAQSAPVGSHPSPHDPRPICSPEAAVALARMLRGEYDLLLPEWFVLCERGGWQPPPALLPTLLARGRRNPAVDHVVRRVAGPRAEWLIEVLPELGLRAVPAPLPPGSAAFLPPAPPPDSSALVTAIMSTFADGAATWAAAAQLRLATAAVSVQWLPALVTELQRLRFHAPSERTRIDLLGLAQFRNDLQAWLAPVR